MAITYEWKIANCEHEVATGGITVAHWRVSAVDGDYSALPTALRALPLTLLTLTSHHTIRL
jgi:hypothetical protein